MWGAGKPERTFVADILSLGVIVALSALSYVGKLGFYSDDWALLQGFGAIVADHKSLVLQGLKGFGVRPVQGAYLALLFWCFRFAPLGYHLVNTTVIGLCTVALHMLLTRLRLGRRQAFAISAVFVLLPQLSTVRAWYAAFQVPLSMTLALLSMHAQLSFARSGRKLWLLAAVVAALLSLAAYEIFGPLAAAFALGLSYFRLRDRRPKSNIDAHRAVGLASILGAVAIATLGKLYFSERTGELNLQRYAQGARQLVRTDYDWRVDNSLNIFAAVNVHFILTIKAWLHALPALAAESSVAVVLFAVLIGIIVFWRLRSPPGQEPSAAKLSRLLLLGATVFVLGHATFLLTPSITFTPTGVGNRTLMAAAIGVAIIVVAAVALAVRGVAPRWRQKVFALVIAIASTAAAARVEEVERYWAEAPALQQQILSSAARDLKAIPTGSTILLDGVCPYHGPAILFEAYWDVGPALSRATGKSLTGDAISSRSRLLATGVETSIYKEPALYAYGPTLYVYNPRRRTAVRLDNAAAAMRYFSRDRVSCPRGYPARGELIGPS